MEPFQVSDTIAAISTPPGMGGIAVIRISGPEAISIVNSAWKGADLLKVASHTAHLGRYFATDASVIDECVATVYKNPASFTGEDIVELSVHGSSWIQKELLADLVKRGARIANPGEFTQRAFLNGKLDLAQAEGVADLISSSSKAAHDLAISQTRGNFSKEFNALRDKLIEFASLIELELDFSEEDVEFADRSALIDLCTQVLEKVNSLADSFSRGAVLKNGVPVVIAGIPNAGKSSLLNLLLGDDKAIVTDIPGTTRDTIEDTTEFDGILYRFIDTAGLRDTTDMVESIGVDRAKAALVKAFIAIWMMDSTMPIEPQLQPMLEFHYSHPDTPIIPLLNKSDLASQSPLSNQLNSDSIESVIQQFLAQPKGGSIYSPIYFSTLTRQGLSDLLSRLKSIITANSNPETDIIITNARHFEALTRASVALTRAKENLLLSVSTDLTAQDIREAISYLSTLTGSITSDTLLHSIFSRFCIGK